MSQIKQRRLQLPVPCHPGTFVGEYVPFYFCPRSVMLYVLHRGNHPGLGYTQGQTPIVHLEADLQAVVEWADTNNIRWAFSLSNAGARHATFRHSLNDLGQLNWQAIVARDFSNPDIKEGKQAEFLVHEFFPFCLVERIGVIHQSVQQQVMRALMGSPHQPPVQVLTQWYF